MYIKNILLFCIPRLAPHILCQLFQQIKTHPSLAQQMHIQTA